MAWVTSNLCKMLEENHLTNIISRGFTILGDCAYVKTPYMATPLKGMRKSFKDGYNFHHSQLRTTVERAFGVLVHRWAILCALLTILITKISALTETLVCLHNFCINKQENKIMSVQERDMCNLRKNVAISREIGGHDVSVVDLDNLGRPTEMLRLGHHFHNAPKHCEDPQRQPITPMDDMLKLCFEEKILQPKY